jgi:PAS domain S-box-containing protein
MTADAELLKRAVGEVARLLEADGAMIYLVDEASGLLRFAYDAGITDPEAQRLIRDLTLPIGVGMFGTAVGDRQLTITDDYPADLRFRHSEVADRIVSAAGMRSMAVAPLVANGRPIGAMGAYSSRPAAFSETQQTLLRALADHAATALANDALLGELTVSEQRLRDQTQELERVVDVQRTLGDISRRIVEVDDSGEILQQVVDASKRLLGSDGAHLTLMNEGGGYLVPMVMAGDTEAATREWLHRQRFPVGGGINGLAASTGQPVWTDDYAADQRIPHEPDDDSPARLELGAAAVAPLRGPGGEVIGTLAITYRQPRAIDPRDVALLEELAGQGSIAARNARLYEQLRDSERRYRFLVDHSPDLVWSVDADGRFTYLGDSLERMTGFRPDELLGRSFRILADPETAALAEAGWQAVKERPNEEQQVRLLLPMVGGGTMAAEVSMVATMLDGGFAGAHGSVRDIRERERLEGDLRRQAAALAASEERANLARELHDSVTQALFSMGLTARALELLLDRDLEAARAKVGELRDLQKDALAEMRTLIFELRPQSLETDGLAQALRNHASAVQGRTGLAVAVEVESAERLTLDVEEALYRIAQEALHNVVKHANATSARIVLRRAGNEVRLSVEDDGVGFDPEEVPRGHLGLVGMRQRAERMGAEITMGRKPGSGSRVAVSLLLDPGR